jgi:methylenetetrahydrofolate dehydrogenase (NADP+)/methenyltetrahydrofolate cyclohydrolase
MKLIDGKKISAEKRAEIKERVAFIKRQSGKEPGLATILVWHDPASKVYIASKIQACRDAGINSLHFQLEADAPDEQIISLIKDLNDNPQADGILLQLPLPDGRSAQNCINAINPLKDVDGLHPFNAGLLNLSKSWDEILQKNILVSCTPLGVIQLLRKSAVKIEGKTAIVIGRSNLVGKPLSLLLLANNATVIMAHSKTENLKRLCKSADIVVAAIGKPKFIGRDFIKEGAAVIDVGINRIDGKLCGDADFEALKDMDIEITPVPGGVGPMTITMLLENTLKAFCSRAGR